MSPPRLRILLAFGVSFLGTMLFVGGMLMIMRLVPLYRQEPADLVPAEQTLALFEHMPQAEMERWNAWFPALRETILPTKSRAVAVLLLTDGSIGTAIFFEPGTTAEDLPTLGPFRVRASSPAVWELLRGTADGRALSADASFTATAVYRYPNLSFAYVRLPQHGTLQHADAPLYATLLHGRTHAAIATQSGGTILALAGGTGLPVAGTVNMHLREQGSGVCSTHAAEAWNTLLSRLNGNERIITEGVAAGSVAQWIGPQASLRYDVLPLLAREGCLLRLPASTGSLRVALSGTAENAATLSGALLRLHASFIGNRGSSEVRERHFEDTDFASRTIRERQANILLQSELLPSGWTLERREDPRGGSVLLTGRKGASVVIGNDEEAVNILMQQDPPPVENRLVSGNLWATGILTQRAVRELQEGMLSPLLPPHARRLHWQVERKNNLDAVYLTPLPAADLPPAKEDLSSEALDSAS